MTNSTLTQRQGFFALCGIIAPILFTFLVIVASFLRPDYSQIYNFVSDLTAGPYGIVQRVNFVIFGLLLVIFAFGLRTTLPTPQGRALKAGILFLIIFSLGVLFAGVFPVDCLSRRPHDFVSSIAFLSIIAAQLLIWRGLKSTDNSIWGRYRTYSLISGLLTFLLLIVLRVAIGGDYQGAAQRAFLAVPWIWIEVTGIKLYFLTKR